MPEFTKGKWEATTSAFGIWTIHDGMYRIAEVDGHFDGHSNAYLIAAAPAMYEALGDVCPEIAYLETTRLDETQRFYVNEIKKIVNKALALADGKEV